jgi:hypothetical protein
MTTTTTTTTTTMMTFNMNTMATIMLSAKLDETLGYCLDGIDVRSDDNIGG